MSGVVEVSQLNGQVLALGFQAGVLFGATLAVTWRLVDWVFDLLSSSRRRAIVEDAG